MVVGDLFVFCEDRGGAWLVCWRC